MQTAGSEHMKGTLKRNQIAAEKNASDAADKKEAASPSKDKASDFGGGGGGTSQRSNANSPNSRD
jgi:hypothetical protein